MLFPFKRNNKDDPKKTVRFKGKLLQEFEQANLRLQYKCANWLERKTANWSRKKWILILVLFILLTSGLSIYVIINRFSQTSNSTISITPLVKSINVIQEADEMDKIRVAFSKEALEKEVRFRKSKDSLGRSPTENKLQDIINSTILNNTRVKQQ